MFHEFSHRHTHCTVDGKEDWVILSRDSKSTSIISREYLFNGLFASNSGVLSGSVVETSDIYLVQSKRLTTEKDAYCGLIKTNIDVDVLRYKQEYDALDNPKGRPDFALEQSGVTVFVQYVTAAMRQQDIGLLPETEYIIIAPLSLKVRGPQESGHPERIMIGKQPFMANVVDKVKMPNLLYTQLSVDMR